MSGVFFDGKLIVTPAVASKVDDSAMANRNTGVPNVLAIIGMSEGGEPNTPLRFSNPTDADAVLRSGSLRDAAVKAFDPSAETGAPQTVVAIRVQPAVQAALTLSASATGVIDLVSTDYGLHTNAIKVKVAAGTVKGKRLTTQFGTAYYTQDNVARDAFSLVYGGSEATATLTVTNSTVTLKAPASTTVATIDLASYPTIRALVDRINALTGSGWLATVLDGNDDKPALNGLDDVTAQSVKTAAYTVTANLQAIVDWINGAGEGFVTATRKDGAGVAPDNTANGDFVYLSGGSDGTTALENWTAALATLQGEDVQWVVPLTSTAAVHAAADAHCVYMSSLGKRRRAFVGGAAGQTIAEVQAAARLLGSDRTSQVFPGHYDYNASGALVLRPGYMTAALVAAMHAGSTPGEATTNRTVKVRGLEKPSGAKIRNPADTDALILSGVLCLEDTGTDYRVVQSVTTWTQNDNFNRREVSTGAATDYSVRGVEDAVRSFKGRAGTPANLALIAETIKGELQSQVQAGILVGDADSPPFKNITVLLTGDVVRCQWQASPGVPMNYILNTVNLVPYAGTVTA